MLAQFRSFWKTWRNQSRLRGDLDAELSAHIESYAADLIQTGVADDEAYRRARAELGSLSSQREACRQSLGLRLWDEWRTDLRYGWRLLRKDWRLSLIAAGSLALGIGANTAVFSLAQAVLLDPLPVAHPEQLRLLRWTHRGSHQPIRFLWGVGGSFSDRIGNYTSTSFSYPVYREFVRQNRFFTNLMAFASSGRLALTTDKATGTAEGEMVSGNFFEGLRVQMVLGRALQPYDEQLSGSLVPVVISHRLWSERFGRSPDVLRRRLQLNGAPTTVVGVAPPSFQGTIRAMTPDVYFPLTAQPRVVPSKDGNRLTDGDIWWVVMLGRLPAGAPETQVQGKLNVAFSQALRATLPRHERRDLNQFHLTVEPGRRGEDRMLRERLATSTYVLLACVVLVLLLACANVANLLLTRSLSRQSEINVRVALGASRGRIFRQVLIESLLLALSGGVLGLLLARAGGKIIAHLLSAPEPDAYGSDVLLFTAAVSMVTGILFGLAPAWQAAKQARDVALGETVRVTAAREKSAAGRFFVVSQIALSTTLLIGAGLFVKTLFQLVHAEPGFHAEHLTLFDVELSNARYTPEKRMITYRQIEDRLAALPAVQAVTLSSDSLVSGNTFVSNFDPDGQPLREGRVAWENVIGPGFLPTLGIPLVAGRSFDSRDTQKSPKVAVVNQRLADVYFPHQDPIGRTFNTDHVRIIGVCGNTKTKDLRTDAPATFYRPYTQVDSNNVTFQLRMADDRTLTAATLQKVMAAIDGDVPVVNVRTQTEQIAGSLAHERAFASLTSAFGVLALLLATIGIYGVVAQAVSQRTSEIGIRMALGAQAAEVLRMVLREGLLLTLLGLVVGVAGASILTPLILGLLYGTKPNDPLTLTIAVGVLAVCALAASWLPARRASRIDPMLALRHE